MVDFRCTWFGTTGRGVELRHWFSGKTVRTVGRLPWRKESPKGLPYSPSAKRRILDGLYSSSYEFLNSRKESLQLF